VSLRQVPNDVVGPDAVALVGGIGHTVCQIEDVHDPLHSRQALLQIGIDQFDEFLLSGQNLPGVSRYRRGDLDQGSVGAVVDDGVQNQIEALGILAVHDPMGGLKPVQDHLPGSLSLKNDPIDRDLVGIFTGDGNGLGAFLHHGPARSGIAVLGGMNPLPLALMVIIAHIEPEHPAPIVHVPPLDISIQPQDIQDVSLQGLVHTVPATHLIGHTLQRPLGRQSAHRAVEKMLEQDNSRQQDDGEPIFFLMPGSQRSTPAMRERLTTAKRKTSTPENW